MSENKVLNTLSSYGAGFQVKVLHSLLTDKEFIQNVHDILDVEYFDSPAHKWIVEEVLRYYYKYHTNPTLESLQVEVKKIENDVLKVATVEQLKEALKASNEDKDYIEQEFSYFCKNQHLKKALLSSVELLGKGKYDDIRIQIDQALKAGQEKNIGHEYDKDIESRYREEDRSPVPTPWANINELLMGGLGRGDLGIIFGNPGGGKSWMLVNMGAKAVMHGLNVCHYTLELAEGYVGKRYDSIFTGIDVQQIHLHRQKVEDTINSLHGKLIVKEFAMGKCTSHMIESHIQKCRDLGHAPDLVIIDYIDLMKSNRNRQEAKDEIDDIYTSIKGMARELKVPIWSVSQVNRAGAKDDVIEGDKAAGSYNKMMIADFAMSLSRKRADKVNGTGRIHIMKNRYGGDGMTYSAKVNTSNGFIEVDKNEISEDEIYVMEQNAATGSRQQRFGSGMSDQEKAVLSKKFFELSQPR
jgi:replicative DNA helicase